MPPGRVQATAVRPQTATAGGGAGQVHQGKKERSDLMGCQWSPTRVNWPERTMFSRCPGSDDQAAWAWNTGSFRLTVYQNKADKSIYCSKQDDSKQQRLAERTLAPQPLPHIRRPGAPQGKPDEQREPWPHEPLLGCVVQGTVYRPHAHDTPEPLRCW